MKQVEVWAGTGCCQAQIIEFLEKQISVKKKKKKKKRPRLSLKRPPKASEEDSKHCSGIRSTSGVLILLQALVGWTQNNSIKPYHQPI